MDEINEHLQHVQDDRVYPEKPLSSIRVAAFELQNIFIKRPRFEVCGENDPDWAKRVLLHEVSIMERIPPHPNIITYLGCRINRGRITGIVFELLEKTLYQSPVVPPNKINAFLSKLQSALDHIHSLGLAHNDISPYNIMVKDGDPILIDFGACAPPGSRVDFAGTPGWCKESFFLSELEHDTFSMNKLRTWLENGGKKKEEKKEEEKEIMAPTV